MNLPRYSTLYSNFHGYTEAKNEGDLIVLNFADAKFDPWSVLHLYRYDTICRNTTKPFAQALKVFFNTEDPITVVCQNNTWSALLGNSKTIMPMPEESATFQMYATPYFVSDPALVAEYMRGISHQASDIIFSYKNCVVYLDKEDLPYPGGNYFGNCRPCTNAMYRICILSKEPSQHVLSVAEEWRSKQNLGIETRLYLTKDKITDAKLIPFQVVERPYLPEERAVGTGAIQKRLSINRPHLIIQDILNSYHRNHVVTLQGKPSDDVLQRLGVIVEWPFRITYEGTRAHSQEPNEFVALSVNGQLPKRILYVRYPYDVYTEFHEVPTTAWTPIYYVPTFLKLPPNTEKVSVDSTVLGYAYNGGFFCFSFPILEGRPALESQRGIQYIFQTATLTDEFQVMESFRFDHVHAVNKGIQKGVAYPSWCLTKSDTVLPSKVQMPKLVMEWLNLFRHSKSNFVDVKMVPMALTLVQHKVCFQTKITTPHKKEGYVYMLSDDDIELQMGQNETNYINSNRVSRGDEKTLEEQSTCVIS